QRTTLKQIARHLGVSATTVSRALNGQARRYRITPAMESRVRAAAQELGFTPNEVARGLRLNRTATIGLVIPDISNPFFAGIGHHVAIEARKRGYSLILCDSQDDAELEIAALNALRRRSVDGLLVCPVGQSMGHLKELERAGLPAVVMDRYFADLNLPSVASDNAGEAREATEYLIRCGYRRIGCIQGLAGTAPNEDRLKGYRNALARGDSFAEESGYIGAMQLLSGSRDVTAILAFASPIALGVLRAVSELGLRVPNDLSLITFDEQPYSAHLSLTSVAQRQVEMGETGFSLLMRWIQTREQRPTSGVVLPTGMIHRASVRRLCSESN
ncbi:MAG: LacI family DNA-binding transcriptional regulator, partial [Bacillota bacterium]